MSYLRTLGWTDELQKEFDAEATGIIAARVSAEHRGEFSIINDQGQTQRAAVSPTLRTDSALRPAVGDWVGLEQDPDGKWLIVRRFTRRTELVRKAAGEAVRVQVVAANIDVVFITTSPPGDFNLRRIERYLTAVSEGGAKAVVVVTKIDLCDDPNSYVAKVASIAPNVDVALVCAPQNIGLDVLRSHLGPGRTGTFVGSSGVGKSTLSNALLGEETQLTGPVRESDSRGRHVTSHRELIVTDSGIIIDTPGMRELALWGKPDATAATYPEIEPYTKQCRFQNCSHRQEPGCAVGAAVDSGDIEADRLAAYLKQATELAELATKREAQSRADFRQGQRRASQSDKQSKRSNRNPR